MTKYVALALVLISACKKDEQKQAAPKAQEGDKGGGGGGKGDGTGGGKGDGTGGGGGKGDGACPAMSVTVDGKALEGLTHGRAVTMINGEYTIQMVSLYNREVPCADALAGRWASAEGDVYAKAWFSDMPGVGLDAWTELPSHPKITVAKETKTVGEPFEICVADPIAFTPNAGAYADKKVVMQGLFVGEWCGESRQ